MYADETEGCVLIGVPATSSTGDTQSSKVGGAPRWLGSNLSWQRIPKCKLCSSSMLLVCQVFAPTDRPRVLYVFACNKPACSVQGHGWRVVRLQDDGAVLVEPQAPSSADVRAAAQAESAITSANMWADAGAGATAAAAAASEWDAAGTDWGVGSSSWGGSGSAAVDVLADDISRLLAVHEGGAVAPSASFANSPAVATAATAAAAAAAAAAATTTSSLTTTPISVHHASTVSVPTSACFAEHPLEVIEEPYADDGADDYAHERELERRYWEAQASEAASEAPAAATAGAGIAGGAAGGTSSGDGGAGGEAYERTPAAVKYMLQFQGRIARCSKQVLRYAYGGQPLWPCVPPKRLSVPRCRCGAERVFEFQLLPSLLLLVDSDCDPATAIATTAAATGSAGTAASAASFVPTGMDWGSVLVFSCPDSCSASALEHAHVVPPLQ